MIAELVEGLVFAAAVDLVRRRFADKLSHLIVGEDRPIFLACVEIDAVVFVGPFGSFYRGGGYRR